MAAPATAAISGSPRTVKAVHAATVGENPVTGKPNDVVVVTYWIPKDPTAVAVLTYSVTASQYDPQGADDVANTFKWL